MPYHGSVYKYSDKVIITTMNFHSWFSLFSSKCLYLFRMRIERNNFYKILPKREPPPPKKNNTKTNKQKTYGQSELARFAKDLAHAQKILSEGVGLSWWPYFLDINVPWFIRVSREICTSISKETYSHLSFSRVEVWTPGLPPPLDPRMLLEFVMRTKILVSLVNNLLF